MGSAPDPLVARPQAEQRGFGPCKDCDPCVLVIFGATGDLARRELVPSLLELLEGGLLPARFAVVGFGRKELDDAGFREQMRTGAAESYARLAPLLHYQQGELEGDGGAGLAGLKRRIEALRRERGIDDNVLFHLAVPPGLFTPIARGLGASGLARGEGWRRLVVEKPFGRDLASARALERELDQLLPEEALFRVDHFLGKETVQNLLAVRFANPSFEPIWNRHHVARVTIRAEEDLGVEGRAAFYEGTGALRDMVQNHLLQLLCFVAIEPPVVFDARSLRDETVKVLRSARLRPPDPARDAVRGQYGAGAVAGKPVPGYLQEPGVESRSRTETFAAVRIGLESWRWSGVPFLLVTGKRLAQKRTQIVVDFRATPHSMFGTGAPLQASRLIFRLQPHEGIEQVFLAKRPGPGTELVPVRMDFRYGETFGIERPPRAYAWLLRDAMEGDPKLFARADWIEAAWGLVDPIARHWEQQEGGPEPYAAGSDGPRGARELLVGR